MEDRKKSQVSELRTLLKLITTPLTSIVGQNDERLTASTKDALNNLYNGHDHSNHHNNDSSHANAVKKFFTVEASALGQLSSNYQSQRDFTQHPHHAIFQKICNAFFQHRLSKKEWMEILPTENIVRILICIRLFVRDCHYQELLMQMKGITTLMQILQQYMNHYFKFGENQLNVDILKEVASIFQKLSSNEVIQLEMIKAEIYKPLFILLGSNDITLLQCALLTLNNFAQVELACSKISELNCAESLLRILQEDHDVALKKLASSLLRRLCSDSKFCRQMMLSDGVPTCLRTLHSTNVKILWNVIWIIVQMAEDPECRDEVRITGGIPLLLSIVQKKKFSSLNSRDRANSNSSMASATNEITPDHIMSLHSAACAALTELAVSDTNALQIVNLNGVYIIGQLIFPSEYKVEDVNISKNVQESAFRALRFLFSMERNRRVFKRIFPPDMFEAFIDVGHYVRELSDYRPLVDKINSLKQEELETIKNNIAETNRNKEPIKTVGAYAVMELLGAGAFGNVYSVKKVMGGQTVYAMKEISVYHPALGRTPKERDSSIGELINETTIMKEQLRHPNIVKYYKTFHENNSLYIIMELIDGAPLSEHFNSLKEKKQKFSEERIWKILIQIIMALRYIHKDKRIVHRDLSPGNIMLGEMDKVTITDFGLARLRRREASQMTSVVGTMLYNCPEIVQNKPYGEKADVWSAGCLLYQMATLKPPFYTTNLLQLAKKIVEADYSPIPEEDYSALLRETIAKCMTTDPALRPDTVQLASLTSDIFMKHFDKVIIDKVTTEKKLEKERDRVRKRNLETSQTVHSYRRLLSAAQERNILTNFAGSGDSTLLSSLRSVGEQLFSTEPNIDNQQKTDDDFDPLMGSGGTSGESGPQHDGNDDIRSLGTRSYSPSSPNSFLPNIVPRGSPGLHNSSVRRNILLDFDGTGHDQVITKTTNEIYTFSPPDSYLSQMHDQFEKTLGSTSSQLSMHNDSKRNTGSARFRPPYNAPTIAFSSRQVRELNDPILQMLSQLHKIIFITQLPPTLDYNPHRRIVDKYKRALFSANHSPAELKTEIVKLMNGVREFVDINLAPVESITKQAGELNDNLTPVPQGSSEVSSVIQELNLDMSKDVGITYEQLHDMIEEELVENGYYELSR
ncbi:Serine/threonine-protein kinase Nek10 [Trichoplax sp. H2]|nr:Serine/threonine-protein kinase Nek10 [Trichoplax sp. H2]|eukprot:RDD36818.1 Serine/threonine-protein kinase Nek10 [Trichoplax sp. H2]